MNCIFTLLLLSLSCGDAFDNQLNENSDNFTSRTFSANDSLQCQQEANADARDCLEGLAWRSTDFSVVLEKPDKQSGDRLVRFPSPRPVGNATNDLVAMEWYIAADVSGKIKVAPAVVVVHESGRNMTVGRIIAKGFRAKGMHAFLLQLPGYGARRVPLPDEATRMLPALRQGIADTRRAYDAVAALPWVRKDRIALQGTSLGGFVTATVAGLDDSYDRIFILLAGGNLHEVVLHGAKDAAKARQKLEAAGVTEEQIIKMARVVEPLRVAHRLQPEKVWLFSGTNDDVVPPSCSLALASAAALPVDHHIQLPADHYSGAIFLPIIIQQMVHCIESDLESGTPAIQPSSGIR
ncbi:MAG: prolyl oligopeptidase family serine peptidase [Planctomycetaceae bacterium]